MMNWLDLIPKIVPILRAIAAFLQRPDPNDEAAVRAYMKSVLTRGQAAVSAVDDFWHPDKTDFMVIQEALAKLIELVDNDQAWAIIWGRQLVGVGADPELAAKFDLNFEQLLKILQVLIDLLQQIFT